MCAKQPSRPGGKRSGRTDGNPPRKVKRTLCLAEDTDRRLSLHALGLGLDRSELVALLIETHCRRFVMTDRGLGSEGQGSPPEPENRFKIA
jgi:hypothetical protein